MNACRNLILSFLYSTNYMLHYYSTMIELDLFYPSNDTRDRLRIPIEPS